MTDTHSPDQVTVLFVCVHNAGRSQMAAAYLGVLGGSRFRILSAGSMPADEVNPVVRAALLEEGINLGGQRPRILSRDQVQASDVVITMGCGDACPVFPGKRYEDWTVDDPAGQSLDVVRKIREDIKKRVLGLVEDLT